jgi:hypothetical protein
MSTEISELTGEQVASFLTENPTFFLKNEQLLTDLYLPHASGEAVSLLERQVSILRERNIDMRKRNGEMLEQGERNDVLFKKTRLLVLDLLDARSINDLATRLSAFCEKEFQVDKVDFSLVANTDTHRATQHRVLAEAEIGRSMPGLLTSRECISGTFREDELAFLFNKQQQGLKSAIVMPIYIDASIRGFLALGSNDARYFNARMDTLFLNFIGEVVARVIPRFIK